MSAKKIRPQTVHFSSFWKFYPEMTLHFQDIVFDPKVDFSGSMQTMVNTFPMGRPSYPPHNKQSHFPFSFELLSLQFIHNSRVFRAKNFWFTFSCGFHAYTSCCDKNFAMRLISHYFHILEMLKIRKNVFLANQEGFGKQLQELYFISA